MYSPTMSRSLADACHQVLQFAATTTLPQRISVVDLIASLAEATTPAWQAALAVNGHRDLRLGGQLVSVWAEMVSPGGRTRTLRLIVRSVG